MRRTTITLLSLLALASVAVVGVWASGPHYKEGPSCVKDDNGLTATCTGTVVGLGNGNVLVTLDLPNATGTTICTNRGGRQVAGENLAVDASPSGVVINIIKGSVSLTVTSDPPPDPTPEEAGCPNGRWTAEFDNITFDSGTLTIRQESSPGSGDYDVIVNVTGVIIAE